MTSTSYGTIVLNTTQERLLFIFHSAIVSAYLIRLQDHYLRGCANRMRAKANKLLERISDRNERNNPALIVNGVPAPPPKTNGLKVVLNIGTKKRMLRQEYVYTF